MSRDPSPRILTETPDGANVVKLLDFGISKVRDDVTLTSNRAVLGNGRLIEGFDLAHARGYSAFRLQLKSKYHLPRPSNDRQLAAQVTQGTE